MSLQPQPLSFADQLIRYQKPIFCVVALLLVIVAIVLFRRSRGGTKAAELNCGKCGRIVMSDWANCLFCGAPVGLIKAELQFLTGQMSGKSLPLDRDVTTLGTAPGNTVLLSDPGVSRKHVGIRQVEGGYELADLGSTNGVYLNGERVARRKLATGDVIRFGSTEVVFKQ